MTLEDLKRRIESHADWTIVQSMIETSDEPRVKVKRGPIKYLNVESWLNVCLDRWNAIKDYDDRLVCADSSALDIGTGFGYFPFVGRECFNVDTEATEVDGVIWGEIYRAATDLLEVTVHPLTVMKHQPIEATGRKYDLVTSYRIVFDSWNGEWGKSEWSFFLEEVKRVLLKDRGILLLAFNGGKSFKRFVEYELCSMITKPDYTVIVCREDI